MLTDIMNKIKSYHNVTESSEMNYFGKIITAANYALLIQNQYIKNHLEEVTEASSGGKEYLENKMICIDMLIENDEVSVFKI